MATSTKSFCTTLGPRAVLALALVTFSLRADPGDVETSHDYPGFTRLPGFIISDYDEDNPADFDFPVARPTPLDAAHVDTVPVHGHRYVIRYELAPGGGIRTVYQTQQYYEKIATAAGYAIEKDGGTGDVTETFYKATGDHPTWVYLEPSVTANVLTIVESSSAAPPPPLAAGTPPTAPSVAPSLAPPPETVAAAPKAAAAAPPTAATPPGESPETMSEPGAIAAPSADNAPETAPPEPPAPADPNGDALYASLTASGRVVVPFVFLPGKDQLDDSAQPLIDRIAAMMKAHPDLLLRVEGHTDNTGDPDDNLRLSAERAIAIVDKLVDAHVEKKRLDPVGVGGLQPIASNETAAGREKNRRIELVTWQKYPAFHAAAPNGSNYYPNTSASQ